MTLKERSNGTGAPKLALVECPICGETWDIDTRRGRPEHFYQEHNPEDFGLSALRGDL